MALFEAIARFVPPPRVHRHRYHGVLAPNARLRPHAVAFGRPALVSEAPPTEGDAPSPSPSPEPAPIQASPAKIRWAVLLARIYDVLPLLCPACGSEMRVLAFLTHPPVVSAILLHLDLHHKRPPLSPARGPPHPSSLSATKRPLNFLSVVVRVHYTAGGYGAGRASIEEDFVDHWRRMVDWFVEHFDEVEASATSDRECS